MTKQQAVQTAGERLEAIEAWGRRTFYCALASAVLMGFVALAAGYMGVEYMRAKAAISDARASMAKQLAESPSPFRSSMK